MSLRNPERFMAISGWEWTPDNTNWAGLGRDVLQGAQGSENC